MDDREKAMAANLEAMKPDPQVSEPTVLSHLSMARQKRAQPVVAGVMLPGRAKISGTDKALVVLYAGQCSPGSGGGCYLVYDASDNSLAAIPELPDRHTFRGLGRGATILSLGEGSYVVAELVEANSGFPNAEVFMWRSPGSRNQEGQWIRKAVRLPRQVLSPGWYRFRIDMAFTYTEFRVCWVDLLKGVLVCNMMDSAEPTFTFVPLPIGCSTELERRVIPGPQQYRTMGCIRGAIKFVALDGFNERSPSKNIMIRTWMLSPDLKEWTEGTPLCVGDLWASESFLQSGLPRLTPSYPAISFDEVNVVYFVLDEIDRVDTVDRFGKVRGEILRKARYVLGLDMMQHKVLCHTKAITDNLSPIFPCLIASEFSAHLQDSKDHQGGLEASAPGGSKKQMKHASHVRRRKREADESCK